MIKSWMLAAVGLGFACAWIGCGSSESGTVQPAAGSGGQDAGSDVSTGGKAGTGGDDASAGSAGNAGTGGVAGSAGTAGSAGGCPTSTPDLCNGQCVDKSKDGKNCGACGKACAANDVCCGGSCLDTSADPHNCGACGHDCLGGQCLSSTCMPVSLASDSGSFLAVDANAVYWSNTYLGTVMKVGLDGGTPVTLVSNQHPRRIAVPRASS